MIQPTTNLPPTAWSTDKIKLIGVESDVMIGWAGERGAATRAAGQALAAAEAIGDERVRAAALSGVAQALAQAGEREALQGALAAAKAIGDERWRARALSGVAAALAEVGDVDALRQALGAAEAIGDEQSKAQALSGVADAWAQADQLDQAFATFSAAFRAAQLAGRPPVFEVLERAVPTLAGLGAGRVLWEIVQAIQEVESWWGAQ